MDPLRLGGLASGMDTESIISKLMTLERMPLAQSQQQSVQFKAREGAWTDIGVAFSALKTAADGLALASNWTAVTASSTDTTALTVSTATGAAPGTYQMTISSLAQAEAVQSGTFSSETTALGFQGSVSLGGKSVSIATTDTLDNIRDHINASGAALSASVLQVSPGQYSLVLRSTQSGTAGAVTYTDDATNTPLKKLGLLNVSGAKNVVQAAVDAKFSIGGVQFTRGSNTVSDAITGVTLNLKGLDTTGFTLTVSNDVAGMTARLNDFAAKYNALIDKIAGDVVKGGSLEADSTLVSLQARLPTLVMSKVGGLSGSLTNLAQIGGTVDKTGHLNFDAGKLSTQLTTAPAAAAALSTTAITGLGPAISTLMNGFTRSGGSLDGLKNSMDKRLRSLQREQDLMQLALKVKEDSLRREFSAMEQAVSTLRSQGNWLLSQIGAMPTAAGSSGR